MMMRFRSILSGRVTLFPSAEELKSRQDTLAREMGANDYVGPASVELWQLQWHKRPELQLQFATAEAYVEHMIRQRKFPTFCASRRA